MESTKWLPASMCKILGATPSDLAPFLDKSPPIAYSSTANGNELSVRHSEDDRDAKKHVMLLPEHFRIFVLYSMQVHSARKLKKNQL